MSNPQSADAQVAHTLVQVMVKHGVADISRDRGRVGSISLQTSGQVVHFGLHLNWLPWQQHEKLWQAVGLAGPPQPIRKDEEAFFSELMLTLYDLGLARLNWTNETRVAFTHDETAPSGLAFKLHDLECQPITQDTLSLDMSFEA